MNNKRMPIKMLLKASGSIIKAAPALFAVFIITQVMQGLSWGVNVAVQQFFFDSVTGLALGDINRWAAILKIAPEIPTASLMSLGKLKNNSSFTVTNT